jgi:hypothetical protein
MYIKKTEEWNNNHTWALTGSISKKTDGHPWWAVIPEARQAASV